MIGSPQVSLPRCLSVGALVTLGCGLLVAWLLPVVGSGDASSFDAALATLCAALAALATCWLWLATVLTLIDGVRGRDGGTAGVPAALRRLVLAACGVALAGGLAAGTAQATPGRLHEDRAASPAVAVAGLPLPERAVAPAATAAPVPPTVVVAPGDSLWSIAADRLPPGAGDAAIDASWRRIYALNRATIGPDPDLIRPAQRLEVLP